MKIKILSIVMVSLVTLSIFMSSASSSVRSIKSMEIENNVIYVDDDYNSSTPGWQINRFDKIQDAIDATSNSDTVFVSNGEYNEELIIEKTLTLEGESNAHTKIKAAQKNDVITVEAENVTIKNFTIDGKGQFIHGINIKNDNCTIVNNIIINNSRSILGRNGTLIINNVIYDGISCSGSFNIINNQILGIGSRNPYCIWTNSCEDSIIDSNYINNPEKDNQDFITWGLLISDCKGLEIKNNDIKNFSFGIYLSGCFRTIIENNNILDCGVGAWCSQSYFNIWHQNYWGRSHLLPKPIFGTRGVFGLIPWINFDWQPARNPN